MWNFEIPERVHSKGETLKKQYAAGGPYGMTFIPPHVLANMPENTPLLLALSGGEDSRALFYRLLQYSEETGAPLSVAHVNHMIRDREADRDMQFVKELAESEGVPCYTTCINVPLRAEDSGKTLEQAAREARYEFFDELMKEHNIPILVTAHTLEDRVETIMFNMVRGTGLNGLCGMRPCRATTYGVLVRPLLFTPKSEIRNYSLARSLDHVFDSTNDDDRYTRNFVRHRVLPVMHDVNPSLDAAVGRMAESLQNDEDFIAMHVENYLRENGEAAYEAARLTALHPALLARVLDRMYRAALQSLADNPEAFRGQSIISPRHLETVHVELLVELISDAKADASVTLPGNVEAGVVDGKLTFTHTDREPGKTYDYPNSLEALLDLGGDDSDSLGSLRGSLRELSEIIRNARDLPLDE